MTLRSAHLPGDYCDGAQACYISDTCGDCCDEVLILRDGDRVDERKWRNMYIQHAVLGCVDCDSLRRPSPGKCVKMYCLRLLGTLQPKLRSVQQSRSACSTLRAYARLVPLT